MGALLAGVPLLSASSGDSLSLKISKVGDTGADGTRRDGSIVVVVVGYGLDRASDSERSDKDGTENEGGAGNDTGVNCGCEPWNVWVRESWGSRSFRLMRG